MIGEPWLSGALLAITAVHLLTVLYVVRLRRTAGVERDRPTADGPVVECPSCGAENGTEYRFCRRCVAELPGGFAGGGSTETPRSRRML